MCFLSYISSVLLLWSISSSYMRGGFRLIPHNWRVINAFFANWHPSRIKCDHNTSPAIYRHQIQPITTELFVKLWVNYLPDLWEQQGNRKKVIIKRERVMISHAINLYTPGIRKWRTVNTSFLITMCHMRHFFGHTKNRF